MQLEKCLPLSSAYHCIVANVERKMAEEEKFERNKRGPWKKKNNTKNLELENFKTHNSQTKTIVAEASA